MKTASNPWSAPKVTGFKNNSQLGTIQYEKTVKLKGIPTGCTPFFSKLQQNGDGQIMPDRNFEVRNEVAKIKNEMAESRKRRQEKFKLSVG